MKNILVAFSLSILFILTACSQNITDEFAAYRGRSAASIFNGAEKALADKKYDNAAKQLEALDAVYPFSAYAQQGQLDIIYAYHMSGDDASALAAADRYIRLHPRGRHVDYAYYMRGVVGFTEGLTWLQKIVSVDMGTHDVSNLRESFAAFSALTQLFPHSPYAKDALLRMAYIRNVMAEREVQIAQFYMVRQAYVAAANRAAEVVQHYQGAPAVIEALAILVKAYHALGLQHMAEQSYRILATSYPSAKQLTPLKHLL